MSPPAAAPSPSAGVVRSRAQKVVQTKAFQQHVGQVKKEMLQIKGLEGQIRWGMQREEKEYVTEEKAEADREILEWRNEEKVCLQEHVRALYEKRRARELLESREFEEFKRDIKDTEMEEECQRIAEEYLTTAEYAQWREEVSRSRVEQDRLVLEDRITERLEERDIRENEGFVEKVRVEEDRAVEKSLEMNHQVSQVSKEREEMLRNLQFMQSRQKAATASRPRTGRASGR